MHIPDGFLSIPVSAGTIGLSTAYGVYCHTKIKDRIQEKNIPLIACSTAFIFAAQMLNFPVLGGTSGHFMGATFAVLMFGPHIAFFIMTMVLLMQALIFGDGGLLAIGANVLNMAIAGTLVAHLLISSGKKVFKSENIQIFSAAFFSIIVASLLCSMEVSASGTIGFAQMAPVMVGVHALIGIGEGLITATAIAFLKKANVVSEVRGYV
ncbi:MAG: energy-coupling factor ABC transporter permease [Oligoflexia bacterium]|nr:energy-coupling factor ABC transporter permease [Oligoflexia bacterium]